MKIKVTMIPTYLITKGNLLLYKKYKLKGKTKPLLFFLSLKILNSYLHGVFKSCLKPGLHQCAELDFYY